MIVVQHRSRPKSFVAGAFAGVSRSARRTVSIPRKTKSKKHLAMKKDKFEAAQIVNPVLESAEFAYKATNLVQINDEGVKTAALYIKTRLTIDSYTPFTWRTHPLHICPDSSSCSSPGDLAHPTNKLVLDWIFLISALNFSFWSERKNKDEVFGVEWRGAWEDGNETKETKEGEEESTMQVWTGYWSLVASLDRALADDRIPITDPKFYSDPSLCPDSVIEHVFRRAEPVESREQLPLLKERIAVMRKVGKKLCDDFNGSFLHFVQSFHQRYSEKGTALDLVKMVTETFPEFRDETWVEGRKVYIWKRAQILVAETWAAFYPPPPDSNSNSNSVLTPTIYIHHPIFPHGSQIHLLTMFADYRVPQILHHLRILSYPPSLLDLLHRGELLHPGCREEVSLRTASIVAVEKVRREMVKMERKSRSRRRAEEEGEEEGEGEERMNVVGNVKEQGEEISSVLIDFYLWDLAKRIEDGEDKVQGIETAEMVPIHHTRSIWY